MPMTIEVKSLPVMGADKSSKLTRDIFISVDSVRKSHGIMWAKPMCYLAPPASRDDRGENIFAVITGRRTDIASVSHELAEAVEDVIERRFPNSRVTCKIVYEDASHTNDTFKGKPPKLGDEHQRDT